VPKRKRKARVVRVPRLQSAEWMIEFMDLQHAGELPAKILLVACNRQGAEWPLTAADMANDWELRRGVSAKLAWRCECGSPQCSDWWEFRPSEGGTVASAIAEARMAGRFMAGDHGAYGTLDLDQMPPVPPGLSLITSDPVRAAIAGDAGYIPEKP
jgi:hypothetical protein